VTVRRPLRAGRPAANAWGKLGPQPRLRRRIRRCGPAAGPL